MKRLIELRRRSLEKRFVSPHAGVLIATIALSVIAASFAGAQQPASAAIQDLPLGELSSQRLIEAFDEASASNPDRALQIAQHLWQRREQIPRRDLLSVITDETKPQVSRELMIDLFAGPPESAQVTDDVRDLLRDSRLNPSLKSRIIVGHTFRGDDSLLLSSLASGTEEPVAFHALKKLSAVNPLAAHQIALTTLSQAGHSSDSKLSASYKVLVRSGALEADQSTRRALLRHLSSVLADPTASGNLQDSAAFALSDVQSLDALRVLLESKTTDRVIRVGAVDQNAMTIKTALLSSPDEATIEMAVTAMELYPVKEIADPLRAARVRIKSPELAQRLEAVLVSIAREGSPINTRWTED